MIVKVQLSQATSDGIKRILLYNKDRSFTYEGVFGPDIADAMAGRPKAFFEASMGPGGLELGDEVPDPGW